MLICFFVTHNSLSLSFWLPGVQYYNDLNRPVTRKEAMIISDIVEKAVTAVLPGAIVMLAGGFRRYDYILHTVYSRAIQLHIRLDIWSGQTVSASN